MERKHGLLCASESHKRDDKRLHFFIGRDARTTIYRRLQVDKQLLLFIIPTGNTTTLIIAAAIATFITPKPAVWAAGHQSAQAPHEEKRKKVKLTHRMLMIEHLQSQTAAHTITLQADPILRGNSFHYCHIHIKHPDFQNSSRPNKPSLSLQITYRRDRPVVSLGAWYSGTRMSKARPL